METLLTRVCLFATLACLCAYAPAATATQIDVSLSPTISGDASGRLLLFARRLNPGESLPQEVDESETEAAAVAVAARDVATFGTNRKVALDLYEDASPGPFSTLASGEYAIQAVLDTDGDYARFGRVAGDIISEPVRLHLPLDGVPAITLEKMLPAVDPWNPSGISLIGRQHLAYARALLTDVKLVSPSLSRFWARPITLQAWVLVPPDYDAKATRAWPVLYLLGAFSSNAENNLSLAAAIAQIGKLDGTPSMIVVIPDFSTLSGATEFANGVNNGPWGDALTTELIPYLEHHFRMDAHQSGRFLTGHSSGGWASLWLQIKYPNMFRGAWATAPDPTDFRDFCGVDLYAANANMYTSEAGAARPLVRSGERVTSTLRDFVRLEDVLGHVGGTFGSFDWVFSPRGPDGRPLRMFNHETGAVDQTVVEYWKEHFDIANLIDKLPQAQKQGLSGKLHVTVGEVDTFYLDGSAHRLKQVMDQAGVPAEFHFLPGKNHNNLYEEGGDPFALLKHTMRDMYALARKDQER